MEAVKNDLLKNLAESTAETEIVQKINLIFDKFKNESSISFDSSESLQQIVDKMVVRRSELDSEISLLKEKLKKLF